MGFAIFGQTYQGLSSILQSILTLVIILAQKVDYSQFKAADDQFAILFLFFFTLFFHLILLNVLNAIIVETYKEIKHHQKQNLTEGSDGFFKVLIDIMIKKNDIFVEKCKYYIINLYDIYDNYVEQRYNNYLENIKEIDEETNENQNVDEDGEIIAAEQTEQSKKSKFEKKLDIKRRYWADCVHSSVDFIESFSNLKYPQLIMENEEEVVETEKNDDNEILSKRKTFIPMSIETSCRYFKKENDHFKKQIDELEKKMENVNFKYRPVKENDELNNDDKKDHHFIIKNQRFHLSIWNKIFAFIIINFIEGNKSSNEKHDKEICTAREYLKHIEKAEQKEKSKKSKKVYKKKKSVAKTEKIVKKEAPNRFIKSLQSELYTRVYYNTLQIGTNLFLKPSLFNEKDETSFGISRGFKEKLVLAKNFLSLYKFDKLDLYSKYNVDLFKKIPYFGKVEQKSKLQGDLANELNANNNDRNIPRNNHHEELIVQTDRSTAELKADTRPQTDRTTATKPHEHEVLEFNEEEVLKLYTTVYDTIIKYFYFPDNMENEDKELYIGYYLNDFLEFNKNKADCKYFIKNLKNQKIMNFEKEIINLLKSNKSYEKDEIIDDNFEKQYQKSSNHHNEFEFDEKKLFGKKNQLYKFFSVYNALFIILLNKHPDLVRKIRNHSHSTEFKNKYFKEVKEDNKKVYTLHEKMILNKEIEKSENRRKKYPTSYMYIFIKLFNLKSKCSNEELTEFYAQQGFYNKLSYSQYLVKQFSIENKDLNFEYGFSERNFYEEKQKYLFDEDHEETMSKIHPNKNQFNSQQETIPILLTIWNNLETPTTNDKFKLFFGFNK